jgi:hypothetical protein
MEMKFKPYKLVTVWMRIYETVRFSVAQVHCWMSWLSFASASRNAQETGDSHAYEIVYPKVDTPAHR